MAAAKRELFRVRDYYERKSAGLGDALLDDVAASLALIKDYPRAWTAMGQSHYRRRLKTFKYGIVYRIGGNAIVVTGVAHLSRRQAVWRKLMARKDK